jgi:hypothetical protein
MMVYMVHLTNQMARKAPIPNIDEVLRTNPDIARQLATAAMQQQTRDMRSAAQPPPPPSANPMAGLQNFMSGMIPPPPPQQTKQAPTAIRAVRAPARPNPQPPAAAVAPPPSRDMNAPVNIDDLLKQVEKERESRAIPIAPTNKKGGGSAKSTASKSVRIAL